MCRKWAIFRTRPRKHKRYSTILFLKVTIFTKKCNFYFLCQFKIFKIFFYIAFYFSRLVEEKKMMTKNGTLNNLFIFNGIYNYYKNSVRNFTTIMLNYSTLVTRKF